MYLFISGVFRSGTTLIMRALSAHTQIQVIYQPFTPFFKQWRNLYLKQKTNEPCDEKLPMGEDCFPSQQEKQQFNEQAFDVHFDSTDMKHVKEQIRKNIKDDPHERSIRILDLLDGLQPADAQTLLQQLIQIVAQSVEAEQECIVGIKEAWCEEFFGPLLTLPSFKVIHIVRDPRAVLASRNSGRYLESCGGQKYPLLFVARSWRRSCSYIHVNKANNAFMWMRYEDLVRNPEEILQKISDFLKVLYEPDMANPASYINGQGKPWNPNSTFATARTFNRSSIDYWQHALHPSEIGMIEYLCSQEMEYLGYTKSASGFTEEDFWAFKEEDAYIIPWLRRSPYLLDKTQKESELNHGTRIL